MFAYNSTHSDRRLVISLLITVILFMLSGCGGRIEEAAQKYDPGNYLIGKIAYNVPSSMIVGNPEIFEVRLAIDSSSVIIKNFRGAGEIKVDTLELTNRVTVKLVSFQDDVEIQAFENQEQGLRDTGFSVWTWKVTAQSSGIKQLQIIIGLANIDRMDPELTSFVPGRSFEIDVTANPAYTIKKFLIANWAWIVATLLIPLIGYLANRIFVDRTLVVKERIIETANGRKMTLATMWRRSIAFIIDLIAIVLITIIIPAYLVGDYLFNDYYFLFVIIFPNLYFLLLTYLFGVTLGKRVFGLKIVNHYGEKPRLIWCIIRELVRWPSCLLLGFIWQEGNSLNKTAWDLLSKTIVIESKYD